jgi:nitrogenase subunit NifH
MKTFAVYGKGGIGKSTISSNIAACLSGDGLNTMLVGCDPKADTAINIVGRRIRPLLDIMKESRRPDPSLFIVKGYNGVSCVEIGGPEPGIGCAGRGLIIGIRHLIQEGLLKEYDVVIFDVPADIVCGGLAVVVKEGYAEVALIATSDEFMSLYAANNLCRGFKTLRVKVGGIVYNRGSPEGREYVKRLSERIGIPQLGEIPSSDVVKKSDRMNKTVIEAFPLSAEADAFRAIARRVLGSTACAIPNFITEDEVGLLGNERA